MMVNYHDTLYFENFNNFTAEIPDINEKDIENDCFYQVFESLSEEELD